jgi:WD40 repeat protein/energy-coupling factor transporter ATP-binding protein EcfA2
MTDIEGSTRLWATHPDEMAGAVLRHETLLSEIVEAHGGWLVRTMGEGDSTVSVFESARPALAAAVAMTTAINEEPWPAEAPIRIRIGLNTGDVQLVAGQYQGPGVNLAARVRGEADAGEILLSSVTAELVEPSLPAELNLIDLGPHTLKGISGRQVLKALSGPGFASVPTSEPPYRGLLAFGPEDRRLYFGREKTVAEVLARIADGGLLAVVGASGSGKSSLLRAGVLAAVNAQELAPLTAGRLITPGASPTTDLGTDADELLIVDQFEELYTQCSDEQLRADFISALLRRDGPTVIGVRADFYGELSVNPKLAAAVSRNQVLLGPMPDDELRRAISEPARLSGLRLEPGLTDLVLNEVAGEPGALPLMSHALRETWLRRDGRTLTLDGYRETGGVSSALAQSADAVAKRLPAADQDLLRGMFLRMTLIGDDVEQSRRRVRVEELVPEGFTADTVKDLLELLADARLVILDGDTAEVAHEVLIRRWPMLQGWLAADREGLRLHRLLGDAARLWDRSGREATDLYRGGTRLDAAVEWATTNGALMNRLEREFLTASVEESDRLRQRQATTNRRLRNALAISGVLLIAALGLAVFAVISRHKAITAEGGSESRALADESQSQLARDPQLALLIAAQALKASATPQAELAVSTALDQNTLEGQLPPFGNQGCLTANFLFLTDQGRVAADNTCGGEIVFGNLAQPHRPLTPIRLGSSAGSTDMVGGPTPDTLLIASGRNLLSVNVATRQVHRLFTAPWPILNVAASPPARYIAIADLGTVATFNRGTGAFHVIATGDPSNNPINGMMVAGPESVLVATTGQSSGGGNLAGGITEVNVRTGARRVPLLSTPGQLADVNFLRVSPDLRTWYVTGSQINASNDSDVAATWAVNAATLKTRWVALGPLGAYASPIQTSPDGSLVAVGYSSGASDVLNATSGSLVVREASSGGLAAGDVAIPAGDHELVTVSLDGYFRIWKIHGSGSVPLQAPTDPAVGFSASGGRLVLIGNRGEEVDLSNGKTVATFPGFPADSVFNSCSAACFSTSPGLRWLTYIRPGTSPPQISELDGQTGRLVATVAAPGQLNAQSVDSAGQIVTAAVTAASQVSAQLLDPATGAHRALQPAPSSAGCDATAPSFAQGNRIVAIADGCINVDVWNLATGRLVEAVKLPNEREAGTGAQLTPDGRYALVAVLGGGFVRIDLQTGAQVEVPGTEPEGDLLAVSPTGSFYAIGRQDGTVDEYDARTLHLVRIHSLGAAVEALAFSPNGQDLLTENTDDVIRIWDTCAICENASALASAAKRFSVRSLTADERAAFDIP